MIAFDGSLITIGDLVQPVDAYDWVGIVVSFEKWKCGLEYDHDPFVCVVWNHEPDEISPEYPEQLLVLSSKDTRYLDKIKR